LALLVELGLKGGLDFGNLFFAELFLDPADDDLLGEIGKGNQVILGAFKAETAIGPCGVGAVVGVDGVVSREDLAVCGLALQLSNVPGENGVGHG
jgi:hypothetical protein